MSHAILSFFWPNWALYGQFFVTMSKAGNQISIMMPDSCAKSYGDSFDTHHGPVVLMGPKWPVFIAFDLGHDTRAKDKV